MSISAALLMATLLAVSDAGPPPNVVLIMTDNHGPWTLGCYGNPDIKTPHIDRLAEQGTLFTRAYANNAVCSPTRATVLTGLMPCQHGVHRYSITDYGMTEEEAREPFGDYIQRFDLLNS